MEFEIYFFLVVMGLVGNIGWVQQLRMKRYEVKIWGYMRGERLDLYREVVSFYIQGVYIQKVGKGDSVCWIQMLDRYVQQVLFFCLVRVL